MQLTSTIFEHNGTIPARYTCDGEDVSPPLAITDVPEGAQSLALIMEDPDVPASVREDRTWDHWIVFNIPPDVRDIAAGQEPPGAHGTGTSGNTTYHGPCPPDGEHRYFFKLYALDAMRDVSAGATKADLLQAMEGHVIREAQLIGRYARS